MTTLNAGSDVIVHLSAPETAADDVIVVIQHGRHCLSDDGDSVVCQRPFGLHTHRHR